MARVTQKQIKAAREEGRNAALAGRPGTPAPYDDHERGLAWMNGYDSVPPEERPQHQEDQDFFK